MRWAAERLIPPILATTPSAAALLELTQVKSNPIKNGAGVPTLTNINTAAGSTIVNAGGPVVGSTASPGSGPLPVNNTNLAPVVDRCVFVQHRSSVRQFVWQPERRAASGTLLEAFLGARRTLTVNQMTAGTFQGTIFGSGSLLLGSSSTSTLTPSVAAAATAAARPSTAARLQLAVIRRLLSKDDRIDVGQRRHAQL